MPYYYYYYYYYYDNSNSNNCMLLLRSVFFNQPIFRTSHVTLGRFPQKISQVPKITRWDC